MLQFRRFGIAAATTSFVAFALTLYGTRSSGNGLEPLTSSQARAIVGGDAAATCDGFSTTNEYNPTGCGTNAGCAKANNAFTTGPGLSQLVAQNCPTTKVACGQVIVAIAKCAIPKPPGGGDLATGGQ